MNERYRISIFLLTNEPADLDKLSRQGDAIAAEWEDGCFAGAEHLPRKPGEMGITNEDFEQVGE